MSDLQSVALERAIDGGHFTAIVSSASQTLMAPAAEMKFADLDTHSGATRRYRVVCTSWRGEQSVSEVVALSLGNTRGRPDAPAPVEIQIDPHFVRFHLGEGASATAARLDVFDARGRLVRTVGSAKTNSATNLVWDRRSADGARAGRGVYFYTLDVGGTAYRNKLVLTH